MKRTIPRVKHVEFSTDADRWQAVVERDRQADGGCVYAVRSTGVYCRPWCPSRRPNRANVVFFASPVMAEACGFRACRKCRPQCERSLRQELVLKACRFLDATDPAPSLSMTAAHAGLSPSHFHRLFTQTLGITPKDYTRFVRDRRFRSQLSRRRSITAAIYASGFESSSRCYASASETLGMTPSDYRTGGRGIAIRHATARCRLGRLIVAATDVGLCMIEFGDTAADLRRLLGQRFHAARLAPADPAFREWVRQVVAFVDQPARGLDLPLDIQGTALQCQVWQALRRIPPGTTTTYSEIARRIGRPKAVRAVASVCAANPLAVAIPCHRVVRSNGDPGGYKWGVSRKTALQECESEGSRASSKQV